MTGAKPKSDDVEKAILDLCAARGPAKTICQSEAAKACARAAGVADDWREWMSLVQAVARRMAAEGQIEIRQ
ncbi:MAG: DUF3253 domain-containing protein, partial [Pseudomonadota bacterium]